MACGWHVKSCAKLFERLGNLLESRGFVERHRISDRDFTRRRKLPLARLIAFLTDLVKGSVQDELDQFFGAVTGAPAAIREVTKAAVTQARRKFKPSAFVELSRAAVSDFYEHMPVKRLKGFRLLALDGTRVRLPHWEEIARYFGRVETGRGRPRAMAQASLLVDLLNGLVLDAALAPLENGEHVLAVDPILEHLGPNDLVVGDRNYDAFWVLSLIRSTGAHFCIRVRTASSPTTRLEFAEFVRSGRTDARILLDAGRWTREVLGEEGLAAEPLEVRLVRIELPSGQIEVLVTSLLDVQEFPAELLSAIYSKRWRVEEKIKMLKARAVIERFTGKTVLSVEQDFQAKILATNLVQILVRFAQHRVDREQASRHPKERRRHRPKVNFAQALSKSKNMIAPLLLRVRSPAIEHLLEIFAATLEPIRFGRLFPRNVSRVKLQTHCANYAPCR